MKIILYFILVCIMTSPYLMLNANANKKLLDVSKLNLAGQDSIFKLIKTDGADINTTDAEGRTPLMLAATSHHPSTVERLLEHKPKLDVQDKNGNTALMHTLMPGKRITDQQRRIAEMLLEQGANPIIKNKKNLSPLNIVNMKQKDELAKQTKSIITRYVQQK